MNLPQGWLTDEEAEELQRLARGQVVLELGAWKGRSTVVLAEVARYVVSVDIHTGIPGAYRAEEDSLDDYLRNVRGFSNVAIVIAMFEDIVPRLCKYAFNLVFIDGKHDTHSVVRDAQLAARISPSVTAFHDWDIKEVSEAITVFNGREPDDLVGSLASYKERLNVD